MTQLRVRKHDRFAGLLSLYNGSYTETGVFLRNPPLAGGVAHACKGCTEETGPSGNSPGFAPKLVR